MNTDSAIKMPYGPGTFKKTILHNEPKPKKQKGRGLKPAVADQESDEKKTELQQPSTAEKDQPTVL